MTLGGLVVVCLIFVFLSAVYLHGREHRQRRDALIAGLARWESSAKAHDVAARAADALAVKLEAGIAENTRVAENNAKVEADLQAEWDRIAAEEMDKIEAGCPHCRRHSRTLRAVVRA